MFSTHLSRRLARWTTAVLALSLLGVLVFTGARNADAQANRAVIYVTPNVAEGFNGDADTNCSLREAIAMATTAVNNSDCPIQHGGLGSVFDNIVYVPAGTYVLNPASGPLNLSNGVRVRGPRVNMQAGDIENLSVSRNFSSAAEAIIRYNFSSANPLMTVSSSNVEIEGLAFTGVGSGLNQRAIDFAAKYSNVKISNNLFRWFSYAIRARTGSGLANHIVGNAFDTLNRGGTVSGVAIYHDSNTGQNLQIEGNLFINLAPQNYAIRFDGTNLFNVTISGNGFKNVRAAIRLNSVLNSDITNNHIDTVTGTLSPSLPGAITINNSQLVDINANSITNSTLPAITTTGLLNNAIFINGNRFYNTGTSAGNVAINLPLGTVAATEVVDINDNWWGSNFGPGAGVNGYFDGGGYIVTPLTWTAYQIAPAPFSIGLPNPGNMQAELFVDFFRTNDGFDQPR
jgi:hypothetical protein